MKRLITALISLLMLCALAVPAFAEETEPTLNLAPEGAAADSCGESLTWTYGDGVLTVSGFGPMYDYPEGAPWLAYAGNIRTLRLEGSVTTVGAGAFQDFDALETLELGDMLTEVGKGAFSYCDGLKSVELPGTFRVFGEESFSHCRNLKEFHFQGGMPKFKLNCLWDTSAKLIYPAERPWPLVHLEQLEGAFQGRIEFLASDGTDPIPEEAPEEAEVPETTRTPETTVPPTTEAATEPTAAPTEAATEAPTQAPTEAVTEAQAQTEPSQRPEVPELTEDTFVELPEPDSDGMGAFGVSMLILVMVLCLGGIAAAAVFLLKGRSSRESEPRKKSPGKTGKPTQAQKTAARKTRSKGGKYSR